MTAPRTVVILASTDYAGHQLYDQRLARALTDHVEVLYVNPPRPVWPRARGRRRAGNGDAVRVVPTRTFPFGRRALLAPLTAALRAAAVRWAVRRAPAPHAFLITAAHPLTARLLGRGRRSYLIKDDYAAGSGLIGVPRATVERRRRKLLQRVDRVAVVSPVLADQARGMGATGPVVVIPPGCRAADAPRPQRSPGARPRAVFVGMISDRVDFDVLEAVVRAGVEVVAVGRRQATFTGQDRLAALVAGGGLEVVGEVEPEELRGYLRSGDFALLPYTDSAFNRASFPLKLLEYLAEGLPVLASPLPAVDWLAAPHVHQVRSVEDVAHVLADVLADAADPAAAEACRRFAEKHSWADRAVRHLELVGGHRPSR